MSYVVKDSNGNAVPITDVVSGYLLATKDFDDYGLKAGNKYAVHYKDAYGAYIFADGEIRLWNGEVRDDVWDALIWFKP